MLSHQLTMQSEINIVSNKCREVKPLLKRSFDVIYRKDLLSVNTEADLITGPEF